MGPFSRLALAGTVALLLSSGAQAYVSSTFDTGADGWTHAPGGDADTTVTWEATGGNPGGALLMNDAAEGNNDYFLAPAEYLGNDSSYYGGTLSFDVNDVYGNEQYPNDVVFLSGDGITLAYNTGAFAANTWFHATAPLTETSGWYINTTLGGGTVPTKTQFQDVLSDVTSLEILGDFTTYADVTTLDNVVLAGPGTPSGVPLPPAVWSGLTLLAGIAAVSKLKAALRRSGAAS